MKKVKLYVFENKKTGSYLKLFCPDKPDEGWYSSTHNITEASFLDTNQKDLIRNLGEIRYYEPCGHVPYCYDIKKDFEVVTFTNVLTKQHNIQTERN